jgi:ADP-L-glycero-D-manno-heptose 6-epimerase
MTIAITGSNGFIGRILLRSIPKAHGIDRYYEKDLINNYLSFIKPTVVFHVGACSDTLNNNAEYMMTRNYLSTKWIVDWCVQNNAKIIYSSSASCYGVNGQHPSNLYGWSKYIGEQYVLDNGGVSLRYFNVYGEGEDHKGKMASFIYQNYNKESIGVFKGNPSRDFVYIDDVITANLSAMNIYDQIKGLYFDVGTGDSVLYETLCNLMNKPYSYLKSHDIPIGYQYHTKANEDNFLPNWKPVFDIEYGVNKYLKYLHGKG